MKFLPLIRELVRTYQAFEASSDRHIRKMGLTPTQFDIIATLGNQAPMTFKRLAEKTLISKSSLCGIVSRMSKKGFVVILENPEDGRSQFVKLTKKGERIFEETFPMQMDYLFKLFSQLDEQDADQAMHYLKKLHKIF
jgi:MarR family transcriptional regulator, 2-MHQ and catechol-resistance regulon repressor